MTDQKRALDLEAYEDSTRPAKYTRPSSSETDLVLEQPPLTLARNQRIIKSTQTRASLLTLPRELRDEIYSWAMPWGNIHIQHAGDSYTGGSHRATTYNRGKGFTRKLCKCEGTKRDDETATRRWANAESDLFFDYETRHQYCIKKSLLRSDKPDPKWPFAMLFVCEQTYDELLAKVYKENAFSSSHQDCLYAFAVKIEANNVSLIRDLRLGVSMGSAGESLFHQRPEKSLAVCRAFSGVRKLHASLDLSFFKMMNIEDTLETDWKIAHWARGLLNFGHLPLEHVSIFFYDCDATHSRRENSRIIGKTFFEVAGMRKWANTIRDQLLAPWDRKSVLAFLKKYQRREEQYHKKLCYGRIGLFGEPCALAEPEQRIP